MKKLYRFLVGYRIRSNYWSNSKLSHKIQQLVGMKKQPPFATSKGWRELDAHNKKVNPSIFWITEEGFDMVQNFIYFPYDVYKNVRRYIINRFVDKTHLIVTDLKKGDWHEVDEVLLHGIMQVVVDFVEGQKANRNDTACYLQEIPIIKDRRAAGLAYLDWEIKLGDEYSLQSDAAKVVKEVYLWWKDQRPKRPDVHEVTGWSEYCEGRDLFGDDDDDDEDKEHVREILEDINFLETFYRNEDTEMMKKIIDARESMWT